MPPDSAPKGGGLSLYANLLNSDTSSPGTISRAPVVFKQDAEEQKTDGSAAKQQLSAASLRFQPTKRPQLSAQKPKPKPTLSSVSSAPITVAPVTSSIADWAANEDDDVSGFYVGERRQRGGRKKRKKNREAQEVFQNWDDIYDPSRPNNYEEYKNSDEKIAEIREWKGRLYVHRMARSPSGDSDNEDYPEPMNRQFAPPPNLNSIPPPDEYIPPQPSASIPTDLSGEDAFARRARMSTGRDNMLTTDYAPQPPPPPELPAPVLEGLQNDTINAQQRSTSTASLSAPPPLTATTISRPPVRYTLPLPPEDIPASEAELEEVLAKESTVENGEEGDAQRSLRPGQKGFAERLLAKYGWTKGSGLGASESGITKPLQVKVEKQKKRPDSEGGGFITPAGRGKIIGGSKKKEEEGKFGAMSEVIILKEMLSGMDLDAELQGEGGGLMQEIGEECSEKYGRVERVFVFRETGAVFVKFTNQLSALRAVNALEGRIFNGNPITARFFSTDKFEQGVYED